MLWCRRKDIIFLLGLIVFMISFIFILAGVVRLDYFHAFVFGYVFCAFFVISVVMNDQVNKLSSGMMVIYYSLILGMGIPFAYIFAPEYTLKKLMSSPYFNGVYFDRYMALVLLSTATMYLSLLIQYGYSSVIYVEEDVIEDDEILNRIAYKMGWVLLIVYTLYMVFKAVTGRITFGDYASYKSAASTDRIQSYLQIGYWFSAVFICASGSKKQIFKSLFVFAIPTFILLMSGNRNDVMFPVLIGLGLYSLRFKRLPKIVPIAILLFVFIISPSMVFLRKGAMFSLMSLFENIPESIGQSFYELGAQLCPVSHTFSWLDAGESYAYGLTYILGIAALLIGLVVPSVRTAYLSSRFYFGSRLSGLGYAMSAEMYYNFGIIGVVIISFLIGVFIKKYESELNISNIKMRIKYGFIMLWILMLVRNSFSMTFIYAILFIVLYLIMISIRQRYRR